MADPVTFKKGVKEYLPSTAAVNELLFTTDTHELFRGTGSAIVKISDVRSFVNLAAFPTTGMADKLYIDRSTKSVYMWNGSAYAKSIDSHAHTNKSLLDLLSTATEEGSVHLTYNGDAVALLSNISDKLALKADLVGGIIPLNQLPSSLKETKVVANIAGRDAITGDDLFESLVVWVVDASADVTVASGAAMYIYDGSAWQKMAEAESMDLDFSPYMTYAAYDSGKDGIVASTDEVDGVQTADSSSYYGKDSAGDVDFHALPVNEWEDWGTP